MTFEELHLEQALFDGLQSMNFEHTTPVQEQAIPIIMAGKDLIACAQTGTGKTAAYLLPILNTLCKEERTQDITQALIIVPTRELAQQIDQQLEAFAYFLPVSSVAVYGGGDGSVFEQQRRALTSGVDVAIATPGRLLALLAMGEIDLSHIRFFILDEADRMLDMGFVDDIRKVASYLPAEKQTLLFSATMAPKIRELAKQLLRQPEEIRLAVSKPADKIKQSAYVCLELQKLPILKQLFADKKPERVIIFSSSKQKVKELAATLQRMNLPADAMHSDLEQAQRETVIRNFKNGHIGILVATDVVARGIDIEDIELVINYDVPRDVEDYIHRIGRTARANNDGRAVTFVSVNDQFRFKRIEDFIEKTIDKDPIPEALGEAPPYNPKARPSGGHHKGGHGRKKPFGKSRQGNKGGRNKKRQGEQKKT